MNAVKDITTVETISPRAFEDYDNAESRLSTILWHWTSPEAQLHEAGLLVDY
jgi:hypothetical protein